MKLYEFFGNIKRDPDEMDKRDPTNQGHEKEQQLIDNAFWFIIDDDELHKTEFMPLANKLAKADKNEDTHDWKLWMPMVKKGCVKFFETHKMQEDPRDLFNKKVRIDLCKRLADHYHKDIHKGEYKLGH